MYFSSPRPWLAAAVAVALLQDRVAASHHRRSVPPFQIQPTHQVSAKSMSGLPSLSWPNAHANETYIALGLEMPIVGIVGSNPELIFLGAESYLLFMQEGMTMSAYNHLNISDNLLSSNTDPLVAFDEPSGIFSESPFSSSSESADLRLLAVLLYKSDTQTKSAAPQSLSSSSKGASSETEGFDWNTWAADMNANPLQRRDFDIGDFADKAGLGTPVAAEVLIVKDDAELADSLDTSESWDIVSTLYRTGAAGGNAAVTATGMGAVTSGLGVAGSGMGAAASGLGAAASGMGAAAVSGMGEAAVSAVGAAVSGINAAASGIGAAAVSGLSPAVTGARAGASGLGIMPSGTGAGLAMNPSGTGSGGGATATSSPMTSTGPEESSEDSEDVGTGPAMVSGSPGPSAGGSQYMNASLSGLNSSAAGNSSSGGLAVIPVASNSAVGAMTTGSPLTSTGPGNASNDGSEQTHDDESDSLGPGVSASGGSPLATGAVKSGSFSPSGMPRLPKYSFPQFSAAVGGVPSLVNATAAVGQANAAGTTPTGSAAGAGITGDGGGEAATAPKKQVTVDINIDGEFETTITANLKYRNARRTVDAKPGWTLTLKTDLVAPTSSLVEKAEITASTVVPTSTPNSFGQYAYQFMSSTLKGTATATGSPSATNFVKTSSAVPGMMPAQGLFVLGLVCVSLLSVSFL